MYLTPIVEHRLPRIVLGLIVLVLNLHLTWCTSRTRFLPCTLPTDCNMGHLNRLVGILLGHVQGDSGDAPLHHPGQTSDSRSILEGPSGMLVRAPLAASLSANSLPAYIQWGWCLDHRDSSLARLLTFTTRIAAESPAPLNARGSMCRSL